MILLQRQQKFTRMTSLLILFAYEQGYQLTYGDAARIDGKGHKKNSKHYTRLAVDLNLFKDGKYLNKTENHIELGVFWESIGGVWGGRFKISDGNHYEL